MVMFSTLGILKSALGNPISRVVLIRSTARCSKCNDSRLRIALARYAGVNTKVCLSCRMYSFVIGSIIDIGRVLFRTSKREMRNFFNSQTTQRGLASIVRGIAEHGITQPQQLGRLSLWFGISLMPVTSIANTVTSEPIVRCPMSSPPTRPNV